MEKQIHEFRLYVFFCQLLSRTLWSAAPDATGKSSTWAWNYMSFTLGPHKDLQTWRVQIGFLPAEAATIFLSLGFSCDAPASARTKAHSRFGKRALGMHRRHPNARPKQDWKGAENGPAWRRPNIVVGEKIPPKRRRVLLLLCCDPAKADSAPLAECFSGVLKRG